MKKAVCILLAAAILLVCISATAAAANTKISDSLQAKMSEMPDNAKIEAHIWLYCPIDEHAVFQQAIKECGYIGGLPLDMTIEEVHAYKAVFNRIVSEQEAAVADAFVEKLGIPDGDIVYRGKHNYVIANLTKAQIREADTYSEVESISCADGAIAESPTELLSADPPTEPEYLCKKQFEDRYVSPDEELIDYQELYAHHDKSGALDWVLIRAELNLVAPMPLNTVVADRVISRSYISNPFDCGYGVYIADTNSFIGAESDAAEKLDDFIRVFDEVVDEGRLLGDVDNDGDISIIDATIIQRCDAMMRDYPEGDAIVLPDGEWYFDMIGQGPKYYSDFNRDGARDILDATCIQRHLVGLPYPTGN